MAWLREAKAAVDRFGSRLRGDDASALDDWKWWKIIRQWRVALRQVRVPVRGDELEDVVEEVY